MLRVKTSACAPENDLCTYLQVCTASSWIQDYGQESEPCLSGLSCRVRRGSIYFRTVSTSNSFEAKSIIIQV